MPFGSWLRATRYSVFPVSHWRKIWSTNPLERVNREVKRRTEIVGVFRNRAALLRLAGVMLIELHDEWAIASDGRYLSGANMKLITETEEVVKPAALTA